jgi:4-hydroxybenzoate polyprenyltransferase
MNIRHIISLSRPHFWLYEFGTYLLGITAGGVFANSIHITLPIVAFAIFFIFPANFLIYGINDVFDYETDIKNPKKTGYEGVLDKKYHHQVFWYIGLFCIPFVVYGYSVLNTTSFTLLVIFMLFAIFYSTPPVRAKTKPLLDSLFSAGHYVATGVFGYVLAGGDITHTTLAIIAGMSFAIAMHAYSAVPDITADLSSGIQTVATFLGARMTVLLCAVLYSIAGYIASLYIGAYAYLMTVPYLYLMYRSYDVEEKEVLHVYTYFSWLNALVGMILFFLVLL